MTIPSSLDSTLAPPGGHVVQLFTQYTPYKLANDREWNDEIRNEYADRGSFYTVLENIVNYRAYAYFVKTGKSSGLILLCFLFVVM